MKPLVIFGVGTFAQVVARYINDVIVGFTVDTDYIQSNSLNGLPIVPFEKIGKTWSESDCSVLVVVTQQNGHRDLMEQKTKEVWRKGYFTTTFVHPTALLDTTVQVGMNCIVSPGAIVEPYTIAGNGVVIRSGAYIGHHCHLGCYSYIAPRASMSGHVTVGEGAFIGNNATIRDRVTIGHHAVIGAGAVVLRDVKPYEVYQGYPARLLSVSGKDIEI